MKGYWKQPEKTAHTITPDGWCKTGDIAYFDPDGYLFLYDRRDDMIVSSSERVPRSRSRTSSPPIPPSPTWP